MNNPYKRCDVFMCNYGGHVRFENVVSAYHVMKVKKCYPHGCIMFKWSCALLNKGKRCVRGYSHIGRLCEGCSHYRDEKVHYQPSIRLAPEEFARFMEDVEAFDEWLEEVKDRDWEIGCRIDSVKPRFRQEISGRRGHLRLDGYLLIIENGFIGTEAFDDYFYIAISPQQQERLKFAPGDEMDARGRLVLDRGRILFPRIRQVDFSFRSGARAWNNSRALVARESATLFREQPEKCLHCSEGALVDVVERKRDRIQHRRQLICLQGMADWQSCYVSAINRSGAFMHACPKNGHSHSDSMFFG
ncbi:hypothetical protein JXO59_16650 [candidate division KSB1 bacterium]|nr:hypothetical protein [candidate division KSB1 bacterium]